MDSPTTEKRRKGRQNRREENRNNFLRKWRTNIFIESLLSWKMALRLLDSIVYYYYGPLRHNIARAVFSTQYPSIFNRIPVYYGWEYRRKKTGNQFYFLSPFIILHSTERYNTCERERRKNGIKFGLCVLNYMYGHRHRHRHTHKHIQKGRRKNDKFDEGENNVNDVNDFGKWT